MSNGATAPRVWILKGTKAGDFVQMRALADALAWPYEVKRLAFERFELLLHAFPRPSIAGVVRSASDPLEPSWPDLVISAGRRNELPARWIRRAAGGRVKLLHIGRPWSRPEQFDLVISNRQYLLAESDVVLVNDLPLVAADTTVLEAARAMWLPRFARYPQPWTAVLLGGSSGPFVLSPDRGAQLGTLLDRFVERHGGSLLITESPRTPPRVLDALVASLRRPAFVHRYGDCGANPYQGLLAAADRFVVTADSASMIAEACATPRAVFVYDYRGAAGVWRWRPLIDRLSWWIGPARMRRDLSNLHRGLTARGRVRMFDEDAVPFEPATLMVEDLARAVARAKALWTAPSAR